MTEATYFFKKNGEEHTVIFEKINKETTKVICSSASIHQEFLNEDLPEVLFYMQEL